MRPAFRPGQSLRLFMLPLRHLPLFGMNIRLAPHLGLPHVLVWLWSCVRQQLTLRFSFNHALAARKEGRVRCQLTMAIPTQNQKLIAIRFSKWCGVQVYLDPELSQLIANTCLYIRYTGASASHVALFVAFELGTCRVLETRPSYLSP